MGRSVQCEQRTRTHCCILDKTIPTAADISAHCMFSRSSTIGSCVHTPYCLLDKTTPPTAVSPTSPTNRSLGRAPTLLCSQQERDFIYVWSAMYSFFSIMSSILSYARRFYYSSIFMVQANYVLVPDSSTFIHAHEFPYLVSKAAGERSEPDSTVTFKPVHFLGHGVGIAFTERCVVKRKNLVVVDT